MQSLYADLPQALHRLFETIAANRTLQVLLAFVIIGAVAALLLKHLRANFAVSRGR